MGVSRLPVRLGPAAGISRELATVGMLLTEAKDLP